MADVNMTFQHFLNARRYSPNAVPPPQSHSRTRQQRHFYQSLPATGYAMSSNSLRIYTGPECDAGCQQHRHLVQRPRHSQVPNGLPAPVHHNGHQYAPRYQPSYSFGEAIAFPDDQSMFDLSAPSWTTAPAPIFPFRPLDTHHGERAERVAPSASPDLAQPLKIETSPCMPALSLLDEDVDASNYEPVSNDDWALASTEYGPSPASTHGPFTPLEMDVNEVSFHPHDPKAWPGAHQPPHHHAPAQYGDHMMFQPHVSEDVSIPSSVYGSASSAWSSNPSTSGASSFGTNTSFHSDHTTTEPLNLYTQQPSYQATVPPTGHNPIFEPPNPLFPPTTLYAPSNTENHYSSPTPSDTEPTTTTTTNPKPSKRPSSKTTSTTSSTTSTAETATEAAARQKRDIYLLEMRRKGHSYKTIKRRGNFREAESTLRGRVRVLTKEKWERVRRPEWTGEDVSYQNPLPLFTTQEVDADSSFGIATTSLRSCALFPGSGQG